MAHHLTRTQKARKSMRSTPEEEPDFQIAPMIDILLVLLVFFISTSSTEVLQKVEGIQLPVAADAKEAKENPSQAIINVKWNPIAQTGEIAMDEKNYGQPSALVRELRRKINARPMMRVLIRADRAVQYEYMRELLKSVGEAGVANITFSVVDKEVNRGAPSAVE